MKEKFQSIDKQASYRTGIPDSITQTHAGSNCNYPDSLFLPKKTRTFTFSYWPSGYCARHNLQTGICGLQNTPFHLTLFPASNYRDAHLATVSCAKWHHRLALLGTMRCARRHKGDAQGGGEDLRKERTQVAHGVSDDLRKAERWEQEGPIRAQKTGAFGKLSKKSRPTFLHL